MRKLETPDRDIVEPDSCDHEENGEVCGRPGSWACPSCGVWRCSDHDCACKEDRDA